jgi:short-subunit dehydrogenase
MIERRKGTIVGITSVAGDRGRPSNYVYGSAKGAFTLYLQGLRGRLHSQDVHVLTVKIGRADTRMTWGLVTAIPSASPETVASAIYDGVARGADVIYVPAWWGLVMGALTTIPEGIFKRMSS